jgi:hypothetical protein
MLLPFQQKGIYIWIIYRLAGFLGLWFGIFIRFFFLSINLRTLLFGLKTTLNNLGKELYVSKYQAMSNSPFNFFSSNGSTTRNSKKLFGNK